MTAALRPLTEYSPAGGCACKLPQAMLGNVLSMLPNMGGDPRIADNLLVGLSPPDDAAVYKIEDDRALIVTTDFLTPIVNDPFEWARIAATNAISDVYAMGGRPLFALNILAWPTDLPEAMLQQVLAGGAKAAGDCGAIIVGGHSIVDPVPKYGLVAVGEVNPDRMLVKGGGRPGDALVLTKKVGVGVIATAIKKNAAPDHLVAEAIASMTRPNASAASIAGRYRLRGGTDVTGYGVIGHLHEMAKGAGLGARLFQTAKPFIDGVRGLIGGGYGPTGSRRTLEYAIASGWFDPGGLDEADQLLFADAQTSGGLLLAVPAKSAASLVEDLRKGGDNGAEIIGELVENGAAGVVTVSGDPL